MQSPRRTVLNVHRKSYGTVSSTVRNGTWAQLQVHLHLAFVSRQGGLKIGDYLDHFLHEHVVQNVETERVENERECFINDIK